MGEVHGWQTLSLDCASPNVALKQEPIPYVWLNTGGNLFIILPSQIKIRETGNRVTCREFLPANKNVANLLPWRKMLFYPSFILSYNVYCLYNSNVFFQLWWSSNIWRSSSVWRSSSATIFQKWKNPYIWLNIAENLFTIVPTIDQDKRDQNRVTCREF